MKAQYDKEVVTYVELKICFKKLEILGVSETTRCLYVELNRLKALLSKEQIKDTDDLYKWKTNS